MMDALLSFLANNYKYLMIGAVVLLFALIGFIVDGKKKKKKEEVVLAQQSADGMDTQTANVGNEIPSSIPETPVASDEPALVFEDPSLMTNSTINEINQKEGITSSTMSFETPNPEQEQTESAPMSFGPAPAITEEPVAFGEPISVESAPVESSPVVEMPAEAPVEMTMETPVEMAPEMPTPEVVETPVESAPVETPMPEVMEAPVETFETPMEMAPEMPTPEVVEAPIETFEAPVMESVPEMVETPVETAPVEAPVETFETPITPIEEVPVIMESVPEMVETPVQAPTAPAAPVEIVETPVVESVDNSII